MSSHSQSNVDAQSGAGSGLSVTSSTSDSPGIYARHVVEFAGSPKPPLDDHQSDRKQLALVNALSEYFRGHHGILDCAVFVEDLGSEVRTLVSHRQESHCREGIDRHGGRAQLASGIDCVDSVTLHKATGRLHIRTRFGDAVDAYRRFFGCFFHDDALHFCNAIVYSASPLVERGAAALSRHGIEGLQGAFLQRICFRIEGEPDSVEWRGLDLGRRLDSYLGQFLRRHGVVKSFQLNLALLNHDPPVTVDVRIPAILTCSESRGSALVDAYLQAAGFMIVTKLR